MLRNHSNSRFNLKKFNIKTMSIITLFMAVLGCSGLSMAQFEEGKHYFKVENAKAGTGEKVEIVEFFNYACPHCYNLEQHIQAWVKKKPDYIEYEQMPAFWNELFQNTAKAFYTAEALGISEKMHPILFEAIHAKRVNFGDPAAIKAVFVAEGVKAEEFEKQFSSFFVNQKINIANKRFQEYKLRSVPVFVVDGQWRTSLQDAGSHDDLFNVLEFLAKKAKDERK